MFEAERCVLQQNNNELKNKNSINTYTHFNFKYPF